MMIMVPSIGNSQDMINSIQNILIRNVIVIDQTGQAEDVMVEVLLKQGKLSLVSQNKIALKEADIAFDVAGRLFHRRSRRNCRCRPQLYQRIAGRRHSGN